MAGYNLRKWKLEAACRGEKAEVFFEERYYDLARAFCSICPGKEKCYHAGKREEFGVWGGVTKGWLPDDDGDW